MNPESAPGTLQSPPPEPTTTSSTTTARPPARRKARRKALGKLKNHLSNSSTHGGSNALSTKPPLRKRPPRLTVLNREISALIAQEASSFSDSGPASQVDPSHSSVSSPGTAGVDGGRDGLEPEDPLEERDELIDALQTRLMEANMVLEEHLVSMSASMFDGGLTEAKLALTEAETVWKTVEGENGASGGEAMKVLNSHLSTFQAALSAAHSAEDVLRKAWFGSMANAILRHRFSSSPPEVDVEKLWSDLLAEANSPPRGIAWADYSGWLREKLPLPPGLGEVGMEPGEGVVNGS